MPIFKIVKKSLVPINEMKVSLEKDIQKLTETNLKIIFGLEFVSSEYSLRKFRLDTLAYDTETKSFVIIEYKKDRSFSVVDQGFSYLALMLNNKADFILEYNEKLKDNLKRKNINWSQSRIIFIANSFTVYQQNAINFKDLPIELWQVKKYKNNTLLYNKLISHTAGASIKTISKGKTTDSVNREIKRYSIEDHFKENWNESRELFNTLISKLELNYQDLDIRPVKFYIGVRIEGDPRIFISVHTRKSKIRIELLRMQPNDLNDPKNMAVYQKGSLKNYNQHITNFDIHDKEDIEYSLFLIKQVYDKFFG